VTAVKGANKFQNVVITGRLVLRSCMDSFSTTLILRKRGKSGLSAHSNNPRGIEVYPGTALTWAQK
jgi:hypothetical protein